MAMSVVCKVVKHLHFVLITPPENAKLQMQNSSLLSLCEQTLATTQVGRLGEQYMFVWRASNTSLLTSTLLYTSHIGMSSFIPRLPSGIEHWIWESGCTCTLYAMNTLPHMSEKKENKQTNRRNLLLQTRFKTMVIAN